MIHNDGTFTLTKADCKALLACISHDDTREYMCAVYFDPSTGSVVTSDGNTLMRVQQFGTGSDAKPYLVPREAFERAVKLLKRKHDRLSVTPNGDGKILLLAERKVPKSPAWEPANLTGKSGVWCEPLKKQFPPYEQIIPALEPIAQDLSSIAFNPRYLQRAVLMADACDPERDDIAVCWQMPRKNLDPMRATCSNAITGITWTCIVMPMRC